MDSDDEYVEYLIETADVFSILESANKKEKSRREWLPGDSNFDYMAECLQVADYDPHKAREIFSAWTRREIYDWLAVKLTYTYVEPKKKK